MDLDNVFSVSEVNKHVKNIIESSVPNLFVEGEISNFSRPSSGHIYFNLKDETSVLKCVFFKPYNIYLKFSPKSGDKVICAGKLTVYERDGAYQLQVQNMYSTGVGSLQVKFEELKKKLQGEGLFDQIHKKSLPKYAQTIGVISSATGAVFQDICNVLTRRFPVEIILFPASVQGDKAVPELIAGLEYFEKNPIVDVIIIGRGGGSQEDLSCFNDESLARTVFRMTIPVISAVGHETDFTIIDFVSDLRAPTPSAAAELVVPEKSELLQALSHVKVRMQKTLKQEITEKRLEIGYLDKTVQKYHPINILRDRSQFLDQLTTKMRVLEIILTEKKHHLSELNIKLKNGLITRSQQMIHQQRQFLNQSNSLIEHTMISVYHEKRNQLEKLDLTLKEFSPQRVLQKGYTLIRKEKELISSIKQIKDKDEIIVEFKDGNAQCIVKDIKEYIS